jgi:hypothetical protein
MIALPPGCTVVYPIWIDIEKLNDEVIEWYEQIGGNKKVDTFWNSRGKENNIPYVSYGRGKWCHHHQNGYGGSRLHFNGEDANIASMFILKFSNIIINHNLKEQMERQENGSY